MSRRVAGFISLVTGIMITATAAEAQLDQLAFIKKLPPTVILVVDTSMRMLEDGKDDYYDPRTYNVVDDPAVASALGVATATNYRRIYRKLGFENVQDASSKFTTDDILAVPSTSSDYADFWGKTRLEMAKRGIARAVGENAPSTFRWGLVKLRQSSPAWRTGNNCDKPVRVLSNAMLQSVSDLSPCGAGGLGRYGIYTPSVGAANYSLETGGSPVIVAAAANTASQIVQTVSYPILDPSGLIPAGRGARDYDDRPLTHALEDARAQAIAAMTADGSPRAAYRNTVVVLIASGPDAGDPGYTSTHNPVTVASSFSSLTASGATRRGVVHVIGVRPSSDSQLRNIASAGGGHYFDADDADDVARAINLAVQDGFARPTEFDTRKPSEFSFASPIIGSVNLKGAKGHLGATLPYTDIYSGSGTPIPQRSNVLITAGFAIGGELKRPNETPGFEGRLRAFRIYRPEPDGTRPSGWKFIKDGTPLWPEDPGRPETAGRARTPANPADRNIYTYVPGNGMVAFNTTNAALLAPHLRANDVDKLITFVRKQPLGAIVGSTPALMDPPSIDPMPDDDYGQAGAAGTYADAYKYRRSIIWVGGNDGMLHAIDARTGYEVWAYIPYNLLPKLKTLYDGQPVEAYEYFVDSSTKIADVKLNGSWRTALVIGQGPGGTFYQAFDVTEAGMGGPAPDSDNYASVLATFQDPTRVKFLWAFPRYESFDPTITATFNLTDGTPGGKVTFYGDLKSSATAAEKSVGFTWSDPAVGPLNLDRSLAAAITGSGYFPAVEDLLPGRGAGSPRAGRSLYLLDMRTGNLVGGGSSCGGVGCADVGEVTTNTRKNALQADPTATAFLDSHVVEKAYMGDIDGKYWRFDFQSSGAITTSLMYNTGQPIYGSSALMLVGSTQQYVFFATGSDQLPPTTSGGVGTFKLYGLKDNNPSGSATVSFTFDLQPVTSVNGLASGERPSVSPAVAGDIVFFTTSVEDGTTPWAEPSGRLYAFTYLGGGAYSNNTTTTGKGKNQKTILNPLVSTFKGRASAPFIVDQHAYVVSNSASGVGIEAFGDPEDFNNGVGQIGVRILSWREVR